MTLVAAKPGGWNLEDVLTSDEMNTLQEELLKAIDGVGGGTYTLSAPLVLDGETVTLSNVGGATFTAGAVLALTEGADMTVGENSTIALATGALLTIADGANITLSGDMTLTGTGDIIVEDNALVTFQDGSGLDLEAGSTLNLQGNITMQATGTMSVAAGATITADTANAFRVDDEDYILMFGLTPAFGNDGWARQSGASVARWMMTGVSGEYLYFPIHAPAGDVLRSVVMSIDGGIGAGHGGTEPGDPPAIQLVHIDLSGNVDVIAQRSDGTTGPAYDNPHDVAIDNVAHALPGHTWPHTCTGQPLYVRVLAEGPTGGIANTTVVRSIAALATAKSLRRVGGTSEFR